jgi:hypothetical protein
VKLSAADIAFSQCVRAAHDYTCQKCGIQKLPTGRRGGSGMECSHRYSRRHRTIRWAKDNADCLCSGCHRWFGENPIEAVAWLVEKVGEGELRLLMEKREQRFKVPKSEEKEIAKHYREQLKILEQKRLDGVTGYIDFES